MLFSPTQKIEKQYPRIREHYLFMEDTLKPFGYYIECSKCGCRALKNQYQKEQRESYNLLSPWRNVDTPITIYITPEHIKVICTECGNSWKTKILGQNDCVYCGSPLRVRNGCCSRCGGPI